MNFEAKALRSFAVTVREGSVTRAAEQLGVRQPTVSAQLRKLEIALGFSLLHRTTRRIELTKDGKRLLPLVEALLGDAERLKQHVEEIRGQARNLLRLGSAVYLQQVPERLALLDAFIAARPDIRLEIDSHLQASHVAALLRGELEAAILIGCPISRRKGMDWEGELEFPAALPRLVLQRRRLVLVVPAGSPLARLDSIPARELAGRTVLIPGPDHGRTFVAWVSQFLDSVDAKSVVPAESTEAALARHARQSGLPTLSIGWFPLPGERKGELVRKPIEGLELQTELALVFRKGKLGRPARALLAFARHHIAGTAKTG